MVVKSQRPTAMKILFFSLLPLVGCTPIQPAWHNQSETSQTIPPSFQSTDDPGNHHTTVLDEKGQEVSQNDSDRVEWIRKNAEKGNVRAQNNLGIRYFRGLGVSKSNEDAVKWFRKAADHGYPLAQHNLGWMYANGYGVPKDYVTAYMWQLLAANGTNGTNDKVGRILEILKNSLTPAQIEEAQRRAADWRPTGEMLDAPLGNPPHPHSASSEHPTHPRTTVLDEPSQSTGTISVHLKSAGEDVYSVPVLINNLITLDFLIDSGASEVCIPADVLLTLVRAGAIRKEDFLGSKTYTLADGSTVPSPRFRIRSLQVGNVVLKNVTASISSFMGTMLLGENFLKRFRSWSLDNSSHTLILHTRGESPAD